VPLDCILHGAILACPEFDRIFSAIFHSISAYCNCGFSIFPQGLQTAGYNFNSISLIIIMITIICGGIGFYTFSDIVGIGEQQMIKKHGLTQQSKIILISTFILIVSGAISDLDSSVSEMALSFVW